MNLLVHFHRGVMVTHVLVHVLLHGLLMLLHGLLVGLAGRVVQVCGIMRIVWILGRPMQISHPGNRTNKQEK